METILKGKLPIVASLAAPVTDRQFVPESPWVKPSAGSVKLTVDGSFKDGVGGAGMILRDDTGAVIFSSCRWISPCIDPLEAELTACLLGLDLALARSSLPIIIDTDSAQLVSMVQAPGLDRSIHSILVSEIKILVSDSRLCSFVKVDRGQVRVSHVLANFVRTNRRTVTWLGSGPDVVLQEIERESLVSPTV
jgi:ribonuclease HI